ncbi:MAG: hypothetical protein ACXAAI_16380, partial [Promethearchaeota archaeon]
FFSHPGKSRTLSSSIYGIFNFGVFLRNPIKVIEGPSTGYSETSISSFYRTRLSPARVCAQTSRDSQSPILVV